MSEPQTDEASSAARRQVKKQRALNALVFLLATAVCVQAYVLWETNERLNATAAELEHVRQTADNTGWKVIPRGANSGAPSVPSTDSQSRSLAPPDPFALLDRQFHNSFSDSERLRAQMDWLLSQMQSRADIAPRPEDPVHSVGGARKFDLETQGDLYIVRAKLPGVDAAEVSVHVEDQVVSVCVKQERVVGDRQNGGSAPKQRVSGQCTQRVKLPEPVDGAAAKWTLADGVLTIVIPKAGAPGKHSGQYPSGSVRD